MPAHYPVPHLGAAGETRQGECLPLPQRSLFNTLASFRAFAVLPGFTKPHFPHRFSNPKEAKEQMSQYRNELPQLAGGLFLNDAGLETDIIFNKGVEIREFAAHTLLPDPVGREVGSTSSGDAAAPTFVT